MAFERMAYLEAVIGADITQFRKATRDIRNDLGIMAETTSSTLQGIGRTATYTLSVPLIAAGSAAVQFASTFESSMRNVNSMAQMNESSFQALSNTVLEWGSNTTFGAAKASEALYSIISAGYTDVPAAMEVMRNSTMLAEATQSSLTGTTEALTAVMLSYADSGMTAASAADIMARITQQGVGNQDDYNRTMQKTLPLAVALGIAYDDLGAVQAVVSQNGAGLDKAGTSVAMMMSNLLKPTSAMEAAFKQLGVTTGTELIGKFGGITEAVTALKNVSNDVDFAAMFSKTGLEAAFTLTNNLTQTNQKLAEFKSGIDGAVNSSREEQMKSFAYQFGLFRSAIEGAGVAIGQVLLPAVTPMVKGLTDFMNGLRMLNPEILQLGVGIAAAVAVGAPLVWLFGSLISPVGLVITAVTALVAAFTTDFMGIATTVKDTINQVFGDLSGLGDAINDFTSTLFPEQANNDPFSWLIPDQAAIDAAVAGIQQTTIPADTIIEIQDGDSLWSIWANDFADNMTWDEFKKAAGWSEGMVIHPGDILTLTGSFGDVVTGSGWTIPTPASIVEDLLGSEPVTLAVDAIANAPTVDDWKNLLFPEESVFSRLQTAVTAFIPRIAGIMGQMISAAASWADEQIGTGINWLAGLFQAGDGTGNSPIYNSFKALLEGNLWAAIDAIIPGLGTKISEAINGAFGSIDSAASESSAVTAVKGFIGSMVTWIETEAAPTLSRALGYAIGRLGSGISAGLQDVVASIGEGGLSGMGDAIGGLGESLGKPFSEGLGEGIAAGGGADTPFQALAMTIAGSLALAFGASTVISILSNGIIAGFTGALGTLLSWGGWAIWGALLPVRMALSMAASAAWSSFVSIVSAPFGWALTQISAGLTWAYNLVAVGVGKGIALASAGLSWIWSGVVSVMGAGLSAAMGAVTATAGWIVTGVASMLGALTAAIIASPVIIGIGAGIIINTMIPEETKAAARDSWADFVDNTFGVEGLAATQDANSQQFVQDIAKDLINLFAGTNMRTTYEVQPVLADNAGDTLVSNTLTMLETVEQAVKDAKKNAITSDITAGIEAQLLGGMAGGATVTPNMQPYVDSITAGVNDADWIAAREAMTSGLVPDAEQLGTSLAAIETKWDNSIGVMVASSASLDPNVIETNYLAPLRAAFDLTFGESSAIRTAFTTFYANLGNATDTAGTKFVNLALTAGGAASGMTMTMLVSGGILTSTFNAITDAITTLTAAFETLRRAASKPINLKVTVTYGAFGDEPAGGSGIQPPQGDFVVNGSHAGGLGRVPYDGYIAELHEGEAVLTANQAEDYWSNASMPASEGVVESDYSTNTTVNTFNITGVTDFDKFVREAKRRGVKIG